MENKKSNYGLIIIIVVLALLLEGVGGYLIFDKLINKSVQSNGEKNNVEEHVEDAADLVYYFMKYFNERENNPFVQMRYENPSEILMDKESFYGVLHNWQLFDYALFDSKYSTYVSDFCEDCMMPTKISSLNDIRAFIKEKTNVSFSDDEILSSDVVNFVSAHYNNREDCFVFMISDEAFDTVTVKSVKRIDDKYIVYLDNGRTVTMIKSGEKYYFNSCK